MFADLHLHTHFSDGTYSPEELAGHGRRLGLSAMALTDHDTIEGCERMAAACLRHGIEFIPGTELTAEWNGTEFHLLGFFLDTANARLRTQTDKFQMVRQDRIHEMVSRLNAHGIGLEAESVFRIANCKSPGRPHVGRALVQGKFCSSMEEAFERFLKKGKPAWVPKFKISAHDAIELIHGASGLAVMAHPGLNQTDSIIPALVEAGLDGIECFHSKHSRKTSERYLKIAAQHRLLITGGSDCHGMSKGRPLIGTVQLEESYFQLLKGKSRLSSSSASKPPVVS